MRKHPSTPPSRGFALSGRTGIHGGRAAQPSCRDSHRRPGVPVGPDGSGVAARPGHAAGKEGRKSIHCSNLILLKRKHTKIMYKKN